jgi:hypothetical protein
VRRKRDSLSLQVCSVTALFFIILCLNQQIPIVVICVEFFSFFFSFHFMTKIWYLNNFFFKKNVWIAVIRHHGRESNKGHYTCDAQHNTGQWYRFNDRAVSSIQVAEALREDAYLLFYRSVPT